MLLSCSSFSSPECGCPWECCFFSNPQACTSLQNQFPEIACTYSTNLPHMAAAYAQFYHVCEPWNGWHLIEGIDGAYSLLRVTQLETQLGFELGQSGSVFIFCIQLVHIVAFQSSQACLLWKTGILTQCYPHKFRAQLRGLKSYNAIKLLAQ